jgi:hypothetical protein
MWSKQFLGCSLACFVECFDASAGYQPAISSSRDTWNLLSALAGAHHTTHHIKIKRGPPPPPPLFLVTKAQNSTGKQQYFEGWRRKEHQTNRKF